jgi:hypothetical protein
MHFHAVFRVLLRLDEIVNEYQTLTAQEHTRPPAFMLHIDDIVSEE